jgi:CRISPR/Cas system CMR subunit Cmr4 (Cas7 group RAMP superfamily)
MGNITRNLRGNLDQPRQFYPAELYIGKRWKTQFKQTRPSGTVYTFKYDLRVVAKETVTVPAGRFETYKIEARGFNMELGYSLQRNIWVAPGINADIVLETLVRTNRNRIEQDDRQELVRYEVPGTRMASGGK